MERLTQETPKGASLILREDQCEADARKELMQKFRVAVERLAAYERIGLMPEEVAELKENNELPGETVEVLIVPNIKPGDLLYEIDCASNEPIVCEVLYIQYIEGFKCGAKENGIASAWSIRIQVVEGHGNGSCYNFDPSELGKTVFKTEEEARQALGKDG